MYNIILTYHGVLEMNAACNSALVGAWWFVDSCQVAVYMNSTYNKIFVQTDRWLLHDSMGKMLALMPQVFLGFLRVPITRLLKLSHWSSQTPMIRSTGFT